MDLGFNDLGSSRLDAFSLSSKARKLHYTFAYRMLPMLMFGRYAHDVFDLLVDADRAREYLLESWDKTAESIGEEPFNPGGLGTTYHPLETVETVVIYLPEPSFPPEAYNVVLLRSGDAIEFYTVELSVRLDGTKRVVLGQYLQDGARMNLGALPSPAVENCLEEIMRRKGMMQ